MGFRHLTAASAIALSLFISSLAFAAEETTPPSAGKEEAAEKPAEKAANPWGSFSATVTAVSDYRDRGLTNSDGGPAIQGSIDWEHDSGIYLGVWASNVDFEDGHEATWELDTYGGYKVSWMDFDWDFMVNGIFYPGASDALDYDLVEFSAAVSRDFGVATPKLQVIYTPDNSGGAGPGWYPNASIDVPVKDSGVSLTGSVGHQTVDNSAKYGVPDYTDWSLGATYSWQNLDFALKYVDTNLSDTQCALDCGAGIVFSVAHTFGGE